MPAKDSSSKKAYIIEALAFLLVFACIISSLLWVNLGKNEVAHYAEVVYQGQVVHRLSLVENKTIALPVSDGTVTIEVKGGAIAVTSAPCPNQYCVGQGFQSKAGTSIVCAHEGVLITLRSDKPIGEITI